MIYLKNKMSLEEISEAEAENEHRREQALEGLKQKNLTSKEARAIISSCDLLRQELARRRKKAAR